MTLPSERAAVLLLLQQEVLERIAVGTDLDLVLDALCRLVEAQVEGTVSSIMRLDPRTGLLDVSAAPRVPPDARARLDGLAPGELAGGCGTAAHTRSMVVIEDALVDPRWRDMRDVARDLGIRSCWSIPVLSRRDEVLGTFALSSGAPRTPTDEERDLLRTAGHLTGIALERDRAEVELREQKELLEGILEATEDPIFAKDRERRYLLVNSAEWTGVTEGREAMLGRRDEELYTPRIAAATRPMDEAILRDGESTLYELDYDNPVAGRRTFLIRKSPLRDAHGDVRGIVGVARDISELRRAEDALRHAQKLESLGVLAGGIAHDFNNLLAGILGNADLALEDVYGASELRTSLEEIRRSAQRASELTDQMLAYAGRSELERRVLDLPDVVRETLELVKSSISKHAELSFEFADDLPHVEADAGQLRQVVMNVLTNASEALNGLPGTIRLAITAEDVGENGPAEPGAPPPGRYVSLCIADDGEGMDDETRARIFDPFFSTKFAGRGLGLAAVQGIVRGHGGGIHVESGRGEGTTIRILFPATDAPCEADVEIPRANGRAPDGATVLVVDDEPAVRELARRTLERAGFHVRTAEHGEEAALTLEDDGADVDAVLLDLTTPRLSGAEALRRMRATRADLPIVLTSGYPERDATRAFAAGDLDGFVQKPFLPAALVGAMIAAMRAGHAPTAARDRTPSPGARS